MISGSVEGLRHGTEGYQWIAAKAGDFIHIPGGTQHAWRNVSGEPVVNLIITTKRLGCLFQEVGRPAAHVSQPMTPEDRRTFRSYQCQIRLLERHSRRKRGGRDYFEFFTPRGHMSKSPNHAMQPTAYAPHTTCYSSQRVDPRARGALCSSGELIFDSLDHHDRNHPTFGRTNYDIDHWSNGNCG
jgi:hypothetical protein